MTKMIRSLLVLTVAMYLAGAVGFAQSSGEATYKAHCLMCHGANGVPNPSLAKMLSIKPLSDPEVRKLTPDEMFNAVKNGKGKMTPFKGKLTDAQIKDAIAYYRSLK